MKRIIYSLGLMLAATLTLTNCAKEIDAPVVESEGVPFEIVASTADTKTVNDGMSTVWAAGDAMNVFYAEAGATSYSSNTKFSIAEEDLDNNLFKGTIDNFDETKSYDWYFLYPYNSNVATPANKTKGWLEVGAKAANAQVQTGNGNMKHIAGATYPIAGVVKGVAGDETPVVSMTHLTSLIEFNVKNEGEEPLTVTKISFTGTEPIVGTYYIDFADLDNVVYTSSGASYVSSVAALEVEEGEAIAVGESAKFYVAVKPFTAPAGEELSVMINDCIVTKELESSLTFTAGKIKTINVSYTEPEDVLEGVAAIKGIASEEGTTFVANLTDAVVTFVSGSNAYIQDAEAGILIYASGHGLKAGDKLNGQITGTSKLYNALREITSITYSDDLVKTADAEIPVTTLTIAQINADPDKYENMRVKVSDVEVTKANSELTQNNEKIVLYRKNNSVEGYDLYNKIDAIGYPGKYKTTQQFMVWEDATVKGATKTVFTGFAETLSVGVGATIANKAVPSSGAVVSYVSDNTGVATVDAEGNVTGVAAGTATITASVAAYNNYPAATVTCEVNVTADAAATKYYVKVTSTPTDWSGKYLIVYESGSVAFDGSRTTLDAVSNTKEVVISSNKIEATDDMAAISFEVNTSGHIKSASGYFIGQTSNANGLKSNTTTTYTNTLSLNDDNTVNVVSGGAYLRYNTSSDQKRFRYYKSSTYSQQKAITLYKLEN